MPQNQEAPVDIVYLWVDGSDPIWRRKRARAAAALSASERQKIALYDNVEDRFRDNDKLRYSLRAVKKFFPNQGHIYVVTDGQTPEWLEVSTQLTVVVRDFLARHAVLLRLVFEGLTVAPLPGPAW